MRNALMLGTFDGVHKGHLAVLSPKGNFRRIAITFAKSPKSVMSGVNEAIVTFENRCRIIKEIGVDEVHPLDFSLVKNIRAEDFLEYLYKEYNPALISCGFNFRFGKGGKGDYNLLSKFCQERNIELVCVGPIKSDDEVVCSTLIRNCLKNGEIEKANELLYEPFCFEAEVRKGDQRGRTIGFPTINQKYPEELVKVKFGVYKVKVIVGNEEYVGICDIGTRPTYPTNEVIAETFIKDFSGDLYFKNVKIVPLEFLREEKKFESLQDLKNQIAEDLKRI